MRYFLSSHIPPFRRVLLVESGSRYLLEDLLPGIYATHPEIEGVDVVTCFPGQPKTFDPERGSIYRVSDYAGSSARKQFFQQIRNGAYDVAGVICSGEDIMTKWKWALAWHAPAKVFILNENGDYFWMDRAHAGTLKRFTLYRAGLGGADGVTTLLRLALLPLTFAYLLLFAAYAHLRRLART